VLYNVAGEAVVASLNLAPLPSNAGVGFTTVYPEEWTSTAQGTQINFIGGGGQYALVLASAPAQDVEAILASLGISDPETALMESRTANDLEWSIYSTMDANNFAYRIVVAEANDRLYMITMAVPNTIVDTMQEGLLYPIIDAFIPLEGN
jgi:hypothetical protein